jgi:hypothetical protein
MHTIMFKRSEARRLAKFLCVLIKEGVTFKLRQDAFGWEVELTGGY